MSITSILTERNAARHKDSNLALPDKPSDKRFEEYISTAEAKAPVKEKDAVGQAKAPAAEAKPKKAAAFKEKTVTAEKPKEAEQIPVNPQAAQTEPAAQTEKPQTAVFSATDEPSAANLTDAPDTPLIPAITMGIQAPQALFTPAETKVIEAVADIAGITPTEVIDILSKLDLTLDALTDQTALRSFVREVFGVTTNAELLNVPNIAEIIASIDEAVSGMGLTDKPSAAEGKVEIVVQQQSAQTPEQQLTEEAAKQLTETKAQQPTETSAKVVVETEPKPQQNSIQAVAEPKLTTEPINPHVEDARPKQTGQDQSNSGSGSANTQQQQAPAKAEFLQPLPEEDQQSPEVKTTEAADVVKTTKVEAAPTQVKMASPQEIVKQVTEFIKTDVKGGVSEVKLLLRPESLGEMSLKISIENGIVTAQFAAENARVKAILESSMNELKSTLQQAGVNVGAIEVSVSGKEENEQMNAFEREQQKSARRVGQIIAGGELPEAKLVNESDVLENMVSYTA